MATLGAAGANKNFTLGFTLPTADWTLIGYSVTTYKGTTQYHSVEFKRQIPKAKLAAVRTVLDTAGVRAFKGQWGQPWPWSPNNPTVMSFSLMFARPDLNDPWLGASITTLLADLETAITT